MDNQELLPEDLRKIIPPLYSQEHDKDPMIFVVFLTLAAEYIWLVSEFDGENCFFGYVLGAEEEWGYFLLTELESLDIRIPFTTITVDAKGGRKGEQSTRSRKIITRDNMFQPALFSQAVQHYRQKHHSWEEE